MLIKLLKYDIKSNYKNQIVLIVSMLGLTLACLLVNMLHSNVLTSIMVFVGFLASIGVLVSYAAIHTSGFYNTMVGRESYFTHTIPASMNKIIFSKFITALLWGAVSIASVLLFWFTMLKNNNVDINMSNEVTEMFGSLMLIIGGQLICIMMIIALCIGMSVYPKFGNIQSRTFTSFVAFIILYYGSSIVILGVMGAMLYFKGSLFSVLSNETTDAQAIELIKYISGYTFACYMTLATIFYTITVKLFGKHKSI